MTIQDRVYQTIVQNQAACVNSYTVAFLMYGRKPESSEVKSVVMAIKRLREKAKIVRVAHYQPLPTTVVEDSGGE